MKKTFKMLVASLLLVMSVPISTFASDIVELEDGYIDIVPYSPALPPDWTPEEWEDWNEALRILLDIHLCSRGLVGLVEIILDEIENGIIDGTIYDLGFAPEEHEALADLLSEWFAEITSLEDEVDDFLADFNRDLSRIAAFDNTEMDFETSRNQLREFQAEFSSLNDELRDILGLDGDSCGEFDDDGDNGTTQQPPGGDGTQPPQQQPQPPSLPQTGTGVLVTSVGAAGMALAVIGAVSAYAKHKKK